MKRILVIVGLAVGVGCTQGGGKPDAGPSRPAPWAPGTMLPSPTAPNARGLLDRRGLVHAHSIYSHDACDGQPVDDAGVRNAQCLDDFRRGLCQSRHDFVFLTDHRDAFSDTEFPETLLHRPDRGDTLVTRNGEPVAGWAGCPDGTRALIMAGCEAEVMPVGLEHHTAGRGSTYGALEANAIAEMKAAGAIALVAHTENYTVDQLATLPLDGFEMYNVHANLLLNAGTALEFIVAMTTGGYEGLMHPDLALLPIVTEDPVYLSRWGSVLARGVQRITTMGTDCHRNTFQQVMADGERVDSYRRMMSAFSNHLLVRPAADGTWTDVELKDALRAGRLYGVFEYLGQPESFDFTATTSTGTHEMGEQVARSASPVLHVSLPAVRQLDPSVDPPVLRVRLLRARDGGWDEVAVATDAPIDHAVTTAGAYRAEVRMTPHHLRPHLGTNPTVYETAEYPWLYSNAIYVVE